MLRRNFTVRSVKAKNKLLTRSTLRPKSTFQFAKTRQEVDRLEKKISEVWSMLRSTKIDISQQAVLKYLDKKMREKLFRYRQVILETLRNGELPRLDKKIEEYSESVFAFEIEQMLEEIQMFLNKRISRDIEVLKEQIYQAQANVQDAVDVEEYQRLVCSFRPTLITNSTDLALQYDSLMNQAGCKTVRSCRIQQNRYNELGALEKNVSTLHNQVYLQKSDNRLIEFYKALNTSLKNFLI